MFDNSYFMNIAPEPANAMGMCRLVVELDGETVKRVDPHIGFSHRGIEKIIENRNILQSLVYVDKINRLTPFLCCHAFVLSVEKLLAVNIPKRASYIRVMLVETARILSHLRAISNLALETGSRLVGAIVAKETGHIIDLLDEICQHSAFSVFIRPGGVKNDIAPQSREMLFDWLTKELPSVLSEIEDLLTENGIFKSRTQGIGVIDAQDALAAGFSGVNLRSCGVSWDIRVHEPYEIYNEISFDIPLKTQGDCYARYLMRIFEIYQSMTIIRQILDSLPEGEIISEQFHISDRNDLSELSRRFDLYAKGMTLPAGEVYVPTESAMGEFGMYLVSEGRETPYRCHFRSAGFSVMQALDMIMAGCDLADVRVILSSLDVLTTETDR